MPSRRCPEVRLGLFITTSCTCYWMRRTPRRNAASWRANWPTHARLDKIVREAIAPLHDFLARLTREIVGGEIGEAELHRCVHSILGQCSFYHHSHPVLQRLHPELRFDSQEIDAIARHIADFSLNGLRALGK